VGVAGPPLGFAVVVGLPAVAGVLGGLLAVRSRRLVDRATAGWLPGVGVGLLLAALGGTFVFAALPTGVTVAVAGGTLGVGVAVAVVGRRSTAAAGETGHAHLTLGAVCTHRVVEGVVVGALYATGTVVGLFGAVVLAGHAALETGAVGGLYAATTRRRTVAAVLVVQAGYVLGAVLGRGMALSIPVGVRTVTLAVVGGALVAIGVEETRRSVGRVGRRTPH
jgi:hypothetical protein